MALLKTVSAYEAFRKRHHTALEARRIAAFLLLDPDFPRSVRHNLAALHRTLQGVEQQSPGADGSATRQAGWLAARLEYMPGVGQILDARDPSIEALLEALALVSDAIGAAYFGIHAAPDGLAGRGESAS
jgi:uncharacterized alpha-E superfamily protein